MTRLMVGLIGAALLLQACSSDSARQGAPSSPSPKTQTWTINFVAGGLFSEGYNSHGYWAFAPGDGTCYAKGGTGPYASPPFGGDSLSVRDGSGEVVGVAAVPAEGTWKGRGLRGVCTWTVTVDVPDSDFYVVSVPGLEDETFAADSLAQDGWVTSLALPTS